MPSRDSWKEAYLLAADNAIAGIRDTGTPRQITAADIANADFRKKLKASPVSLRQPDYQGPEAQASDDLEKRIEAGGFDGFLAQTEKVANTPVIKEALNVLTTGAYATANTADNVLDGIRNLRDGNLRGISDIAMAPVTGIAQGVNAGIAQNKDDATLWHDVIKHGTEDMGLDAENDAAKWVQGIGGFAGDVLLDPTTYLSLGSTALVKGAAEGAKAATKGAKSLAEQMLKDGTKAADATFKEGSKSGQTVKEVAENTKGRLSNAVIQGIRAERNWREEQKIAKAQRKAQRADNSPVEDLPDQFVGTDVSDFDKAVKANEEAVNAPAMSELNKDPLTDINAAPTAPVAEVHVPKAEAPTEVISEVPSIEKVLDEIIESEKPASGKMSLTQRAREAGYIKDEPVKPPARNELEEAVNNEPLVKAPEPDHSELIMKTRGNKIAEFEKRFQTSFYKNPQLLKALQEPEKVIHKIPDGDPIRVPRIQEDKIGPNSQFISRNAEGSDARRAQQVKADAKKAVIADKDFTKGPQQKEFTPFRDEEGNPSVPTADTIDNYVDLEALEDAAKANPDLRLTGNIKGGGISQIKVKQFLDSLEAGHSARADKLIQENLHLLAQYAHEGAAVDNLDELAAAFKAKSDEFHGLGNPAHEPVGELPDEVAKVLEDDTVLEQLYKEVEIDNPNKWTSDLALSFKILKDIHRNLSPEEILSLTRPMTKTEVKRLIMKEGENGLNAGELKALKDFTGGKTREEIFEKFWQMKEEFKLWQRGQKSTVAAKSKIPTREESVNKIIDSHPIKPTEENIAKAQEDAAEAAEAVVSHPDALNEAVQQSHRVQEFEDAAREINKLEPQLLKEFAFTSEKYSKYADDPKMWAKAGAQVIKDAGHNGVVAAIKEQFKEAPFMTNTGYRTMTKDKLTGSGWKPESWSSNSQLALFKTIMDETLRAVPRLNGKYDAFKRRRFFMSALRIADKELRAMGVEPFLNQVDSFAGKGLKKFTVNLSAYDILRSIEEVDGKALQDMLFGGQRNGYTLTQIQGAVESMIKMRHSGKSEEQVIRSIRSNLLNSQARNGRPLRNDAASVGVREAKTGRVVDAQGRAAGTGATRSKLDAAIKAGVSPEKAILEQGRNTVALSNLIADPRVYQKLNYNMLVNHAAHASKLGQKIDDLSEETILQMAEMSTMTGPGQVMQKFNEIRDGLTKEFSKEDFDIARQGFDAKLTTLIGESERFVIDSANKRASISAKPKAKEVKKADDVPEILPNGKPAHTENGKKPPVEEKHQDVINASHAEDAAKAEASAVAVIEEAKLVPENVISPDVVDQTVDIMAASISQAALRKLHPIEKLINPALGLTGNTLRAIQSGSHSIARQQAFFHETLGAHIAKYSPEQLATDFKRLQELGRDASRRANGAILIGDEASSVKELYGIIGTMMEVSAKNVFARNAIGVSHFNKLAQANGLPEMWRFDPTKTAVENGHLWTEWTDIEEKGIQDFLSRMHSITIKASQEIAIAADFSMRFGSKTNTASNDLVKIVWKNKKENNASFFDLIDKNLYYPRELAGQVVAIDRLMNESRSISPKTPFGRFIINVFDPITNALKASQTTVRPGHWVVSVIGDLLRNQIAGVNSIQPYRHAVEIMRAGKLDPDSFIGKIDSAEALAKYRKSQEINNGFMATGKGKGAVLHIGGKKVNVSYDTLYRLMNDVVMLPKHRGGGGVLEDRFIGEAVTSKFARGLEKATDFVTDNKKFSLNDLAAKRDNLMRISMAIDFASKRQWKDLREMKAAMEGQVTKWAPTSTDMTGFEAKYVRRTMLYYTWLRGITPRMIDSAMTRPGVTTMVPKALYNIAAANGLNPESIGNPFPEDDGLFPSYYYNNVLGPQWKDEYGMWGINPSSPVIEVANTFSRIKPGQPVENVINTGAQLTGMANPFIRMPIEGAMRTQSNGIPITDGSQYLLDNLGGSYIGAISRGTGKTLNQNGIVDRTDSAAKDTPEEQMQHLALQAFNFGTGLKLTDYKSDSAQRAAYYDQKEALNSEAERIRRSQ
jgi:hypothetical protein